MKTGSGHPRASTIKDDHRQGSNGIINRFLNTAKRNVFCSFTKSIRVKETGVLPKLFGFFFAVNKSFLTILQNSHFKTVVVIYCGSSVATRTSFRVHFVFNFNSFHSWKICFHLLYYKTLQKNHLKIIFSCLNTSTRFLFFVKTLSYFPRNYFFVT